MSGSNSVMITIVNSLILCAVYQIFSEGIITVFGGTVNPETFRHSKEYYFRISVGIPFYMFGQAMNPFIRADRSTKFAMFSTLAGAVINMIFDPVFGLEQYAQIAMSVVGIVIIFFQIVIFIVVGMAAGSIPIVGFNMGAGLNNRSVKWHQTVQEQNLRSVFRTEAIFSKLYVSVFVLADQYFFRHKDRQVFFFPGLLR